jgi:hypothetical protein
VPDGAAGRGAGEVPTVTAAEAAPRSIAEHAEVYAQNLETLLAKRGRAPQAAQVEAAADPAREPTASPEASPEATPAGANAAAEVARAPVNVPDLTAEVPLPNALHLPTTKMLSPPASKPTEPAAPAAPAPIVPAPKAAPAPAPADPFHEQLTTRAKEYPRDAAAQLDYQILQFLRDESVPDLAPLSPLPAEDRELLTTLLDGLSNFRNGLRAEANMLQSKKVSPLLEMGDRLRGQGELSLPTTALCTKVERFGVYEPMEPAQFKGGVNNEAVLYCEVANFSSQLGQGRQWETRLKHECVLYSETGLAVWQDKADAVTDLSRNRRHDFYVVKRLRVPALPVGRYLLKVTVTDLQVNRVAEATVSIQVVAQ